MKSSWSSDDEAVRSLEQTLLDVASVTPEIERFLAKCAANEEDDYRREQRYRSLCMLCLRQGRVSDFEDLVSAWKSAATLSLHSALWVAQLLRHVARPHLALEVLLLFADSDWGSRAGAARLHWLELLVHLLRDVDDIFTAVDVCERVVALNASLGNSHSWLAELDMTSVARFYGLLADAYLAFSRVNGESNREVIEYTERQKAAFFSRGLETTVPEVLSPEARKAYRDLVTRLAVLEGDSSKNYRHALAAVPFPGQLSRAGNLSMLDSHTIVAAKDLAAERKREREMDSVRRELLRVREEWPAQSSQWSSAAIGQESVFEQIARIGTTAPTASLVYRIDRLEEVVLIFVVDSQGQHEQFVSDVSIASLDALVFMLDQYPAREFEYIVSALSEMLLPSAVCAHLSGCDVRHLLISADPGLSGVPWEALGQDDWRLGTRFALSNTPSLLSPCRQISETAAPVVRLSNVAIVADPTENLPGALSEGYDIRRLLKERGISSELLSTCTADRFRDALRSYGFIHFAGHTSFSRQDPASSCVILNDAPLTALEIGSTSIQGSAIVLSSCASGRGGQSEDIENPFGVCNAFLLAGASAVIATNWLAEDGSSDLMMTSLYRALLASDGDSLAELLRRFRAELFDDGESIAKWAMYSLWGHPFVRVQRG
jgi:CHAT domain-containing protein